jgi:hypothetical protein
MSTRLVFFSKGNLAGIGGSILTLATITITHLCTSQSLSLLSNRQLESIGNNQAARRYIWIAHSTCDFGRVKLSR